MVCWQCIVWSDSGERIGIKQEKEIESGSV
jgi:hypothetical protein